MERIGAFYQRIRKEGHGMQWEATLRVCTELRNRHGGRNPHSAIIAKYIGMKERKMPKRLPIADRINLLRHKRRMSVARLAEALDVPLHTYMNWERKDGPYPRTESLVMLAQFFGTSIDYLVGLTDDPRPAPCGS